MIGKTQLSVKQAYREDASETESSSEPESPGSRNSWQSKAMVVVLKFGLLLSFLRLAEEHLF